MATVINDFFRSNQRRNSWKMPDGNSDFDEVVDFFKVDLVPRQTYPTVNEFLNDYYSSINVLEFKTFFTYLLDFATGVLSHGLKEGQSKLMSVQKVAAINRRLSCLCFDKNKEISVDGNAKISEIDNLNDSFYELDDVDLRIIEQNISNIQRGVIEFEDCENLKIPLDLQASITALENLTFNEKTNNVDEIDDALNILYPSTGETFKQSLDTNYLQQFLNALMATVLSPKAILPFMIMLFGTNQPIPSQVKNIESFAVNYKTFYSNFITTILAKLTKSVFQELSKAIQELILFINSDLVRKKRQKLTKIIISIITLIVSLSLSSGLINSGSLHSSNNEGANSNGLFICTGTAVVVHPVNNIADIIKTNFI
jgi:hypothetical protein